MQILGGEKLLKVVESAGEIFLSGLSGAIHSSVAFRIVFRVLFRVFQTVFRIDLKVFRGQFRSADMPALMNSDWWYRQSLSDRERERDFASGSATSTH